MKHLTLANRKTKQNKTQNSTTTMIHTWAKIWEIVWIKTILNYCLFQMMLFNSCAGSSVELDILGQGRKKRRYHQSFAFPSTFNKGTTLNLRVSLFLVLLTFLIKSLFLSMTSSISWCGDKTTWTLAVTKCNFGSWKKKKIRFFTHALLLIFNMLQLNSE